MNSEDMLAHPQLPPGLIERCVDVPKQIMPSERDLIRVVVEIIVELREGDEVEETENILAVVRNLFSSTSHETETIPCSLMMIRQTTRLATRAPYLLGNREIVKPCQQKTVMKR